MEFVLFLGFLYSQILQKKARKILLFSGLFFFIFYIAFTFLKDGSKHFDSIQIGVETIIILVFAYYYLYERMNDTSTLFIYSTYSFWVILGIVLSLSGSLFVYIFTNYLSNEEINRYWVITNVLSFLRFVFFTIAIIINAKPPRNNISLI